MKAGSGDNGRVRKAEVFEIAAVVSMAIRTVGVNRRSVWQGASHELSVLPKILPSRYGIGTTQGWSPRAGVFLSECFRLQDAARIAGQKIEGQHSETAHYAIRMVEAKTNGVGTLN